MARAKKVEAEVVEEVPPQNTISTPKESVFDGGPMVGQGAIVKSDDIPAPDSDLTPDEKELFKKLLDKEIGLEERARRLAHLARLKGTKTAGVGLRAIQAINELTGLSKEGDPQAAPLFVLPEGVRVGVIVGKLDK